MQFPDRGDFLIFLLGALILGLTMPADFCQSDAFAPRFEAVHWLETGRLGVDPRSAETLVPGQYFVRNPETGLYHPKYGLLHTMSAALYLQAGKGFIGGGMNPMSDGLRGLLIVNISHLLLALTTLILVGRLAALFTASVWIRVVFVLASAFSTFTWFYLRAQTLDLIQAVLVLGGTLALLHLSRFSAAGRSDTPAARVAALASGACFGLALLTKPSHALLLPIAMAGVLWATGFPRTPKAWKTVAAFVWPSAALTLLFFISNEVRFGSPLDFGYHHWKNESEPLSGDVWAGAVGLMFDPQHGALLSYPIFAMALLRWSKFWKRFTAESILIIAQVLVVFFVNASFVNWAGHFSTGPRYLLPVLPLASLPFILLLSDIPTIRPRIARPLAAGAVGVILVFSTVQQFAVQRLPFFFQYDLSKSLQTLGVSGALTYFEDTPTAHLALQLSLLRKDHGTFPLLNSIELEAGQENAHTYREALVLSLPPNFLLVRLLAGRQPSDE